MTIWDRILCSLFPIEIWMKVTPVMGSEGFEHLWFVIRASWAKGFSIQPVWVRRYIFVLMVKENELKSQKFNRLTLNKILPALQHIRTNELIGRWTFWYIEDYNPLLSKSGLQINGVRNISKPMMDKDYRQFILGLCIIKNNGASVIIDFC